jgi:uncharacterized protein (TIGR02145 family)
MALKALQLNHLTRRSRGVKVKSFKQVMGAAVVVVGLIMGIIGCGGSDSGATTFKLKIEANPKNGESVSPDANFEKFTPIFTDSRDGKTYRRVRIDGLTWMAENLNYTTGNSLCYGGDESNCQKYGRLYDWNTAIMACPSGWRLPTRDDWNNLIEAAGGGVAGTKLKASSPDWNGTDDFGFSALSGGRGPSASFYFIGVYGSWWSATEYDAGGAWGRGMYSGNENVVEYYYLKSYCLSVRCVQP